MFILMWQGSSGQPQVVKVNIFVYDNHPFLSSHLLSCGSDMMIISTVTIHGYFCFPSWSWDISLGIETGQRLAGQGLMMYD
jgi:hypothetical protein